MQHKIAQDNSGLVLFMMVSLLLPQEGRKEKARPPDFNSLHAHRSISLLSHLLLRSFL